MTEINGRENRPTPGIFFQKTLCSIFPPCSILPRLPINVYTKCLLLPYSIDRVSTLSIKKKSSCDMFALLHVNNLYCINILDRSFSVTWSDGSESFCYIANIINSMPVLLSYRRHL